MAPWRTASTIIALRRGTQRLVSGDGKSATFLICAKTPSFVDFRGVTLSLIQQHRLLCLGRADHFFQMCKKILWSLRCLGLQHPGPQQVQWPGERIVSKKISLFPSTSIRIAAAALQCLRGAPRATLPGCAGFMGSTGFHMRACGASTDTAAVLTVSPEGHPMVPRFSRYRG
jgi:hypothetical protein